MGCSNGHEFLVDLVQVPGSTTAEGWILQDGKWRYKIFFQQLFERLRLRFRTNVDRWSNSVLFFILEDLSPFCGAAYIPVLDFWIRLPWVNSVYSFIWCLEQTESSLFNSGVLKVMLHVMNQKHASLRKSESQLQIQKLCWYLYYWVTSTDNNIFLRLNLAMSQRTSSCVKISGVINHHRYWSEGRPAVVPWRT